jgi:hypothetical protein
MAMATESLRLLPPGGTAGREGCYFCSGVDAEFAAGTLTRQGPGQFIDEVAKRQLSYDLINLVLQLPRCDAFQASVELKVLVHGQRVKERVELRAVADKAAHRFLLRHNVEAGKPRAARGRHECSCEHLYRSRLA